MRGEIIDCEFRIHYTKLSGKKKTVEKTQVFQLPVVFYDSEINKIYDPITLIQHNLVKFNYVKFKDIQENKIINAQVEIVKKLKSLGFTNYEI